MDIVRMTDVDVQRSPIVTLYVDIYQYSPSKPMDFRDIDTILKTMDNPLNETVSSEERKNPPKRQPQEENPLVESIPRKKRTSRNGDAALIPKEDLPKREKMRNKKYNIYKFI